MHQKPKKTGSTAWDRTRDDAINSRALYLLSYREMKKGRLPLTAFAHALVQLAIVARLPALGLRMAEPGAAGGDDAVQECANNALAGLGGPLVGCCVSGCNGNLLEVG